MMMTSNGERLRSSAAPDPERAHSLGAVAKDAAADLLDLIGAQIRLVRAELSGEVRAGLSRIARVALFAPIVMAGYLFGIAALAALLAPYWGWPLALAAVAVVQLIVGVWGVLWSLRKLARVRLLHRTADEVAETVRRIEATSHAPSPATPHGSAHG
jgi:uncharacterized membrane protein YqjE